MQIECVIRSIEVMLGMQNAVHDRIAQQHVRMRHVDLSPKHFLPVAELARAHPLEQIEILFDGPVPPRAFRTRHGHRAASLANLLLRLIVHIGESFFYQLLGPLVQLIEIVRRIVFAGPLESEPAHVLFDRIDVLDVLLDRIRIVEAQIAQAAVFLGQAEVQANTLGMPYVQIAVGLRRKASLDTLVAARDTFLDNLFQKIQGPLHRCRRFVRIAHGSIK